MIGGVFGNAILGFYSMAERIISAPVALISNALGDVYRQRASVSWRESGSFDSLYWKTLLLTSVTGVPVFSVGILFAPNLFVLILGDDWRIAGEYAQIMLVGGLFGFITSPVDKGAVIVGASKFIILWNLARLLGIVIVIVATALFSLDIYLFVCLLTLNRVSIYLINVWFEYGFASGLSKYV
jgi:O-antigen/teichoic acid export membrane protein